MKTVKFTPTDIIKFKYTWTIHSFSKRSEEIYSPTFPKIAYNELQWQLVVHPDGVNLDCENFVSIFVQLDSHTKHIDDIPGNVRLKLLDFPSKDIPIRKYRVDHSLDDDVIGFDKFIERNVLLNKLIDDKLIIFCEISSSMVDSTQTVACRSRLADDFDSLFEYQDFSDVTLSVGKRKIKAHKAILGARSPVFKAMFTHDMKENLQNDVNITDVKYEVLKELLRYIYTEKVQNMGKFKMDLLIAADKYQLEELKTICEKAVLSIDISDQNFCEIFIIAEKHRAYLLKTIVLNYIRTHSQHIVNTPGWKTMMEEYPDLVEEAFCAVSERSFAIKILK